MTRAMTDEAVRIRTMLKRLHGREASGGPAEDEGTEGCLARVDSSIHPIHLCFVVLHSPRLFVPKHHPDESCILVFSKITRQLLRGFAALLCLSLEKTEAANEM